MEEEFKVVRKKKNDDLNKLIIKAKEDSSAQFQLGVKYYNGDGVEQSYEEAVKWFTKSAENGHSQAQYNLAVMYEDGEGVKQNIDEAVKWYKESAKNGNNDSIEALKELGIDYKKEPTTPEEQFQFANDCYKEKKYEEAIKWCKKSAEQGHTKAQHTLAKMYYKGQGVKQDYEESFKWFGKSIENGTAKDQYDLGMRYYKGEQVKQNYKEAIKWFEKSAKQGHIEAQYNLGTIYYNGNIVEQNYEEAIKWFIKSAEQGNSKAQYNLGAMYEAGEGVKENIEEAIKWYKKSADQGNNDSIEALKELGIDFKKDEELVVFVDPDEEITDPDEQFKLGLKYYTGRDVKKDFSKAFKLFKKSADQGNVQAMFKVGSMYEDGEGVGQNNRLAYEYFSKSAEKENPQGQFRLGNMYYEGKGVEKSLLMAFKCFLKSAKQGHSEAQCKVADMYINGEGTVRSREKAIEWYTKSANFGFINAKKALEKLNAEKVNLEKINLEKNSQKSISVNLKKNIEPVDNNKPVDNKKEENDIALYSLGLMYYDSDEPNYEEAFKCFMNLAKNGNSQAQYNLGVMYENGEGTELNIEKAIKWYRKSAENGDEDAKEALKDLELNRNRDKNKEAIIIYNLGMKDYRKGFYKEAFSKFLNSAQLGNSQAQYNLGVMYENGEGAEANIEKAKKWYEKASENGDKEASDVLAELNGYKIKSDESSQQVKLPDFSNMKFDGLVDFLRNISNFIARKAGNLAGAIMYSTPDDRRKWLKYTKIVCFLVSIIWVFIFLSAGSRGAFYTNGEVSLGVIFTFPDPDMHPFGRILLNLFIVVGFFTGGIVEIFKAVKTGWKWGYAVGEFAWSISSIDTWRWMVGTLFGVMGVILALSFSISFICIPFGISAFKKED